jgi:hypothetical protein
MANEQLIEHLEGLQNLLIDEIDNGFMDDDDYRRLRRELMRHPRLGNRMPTFVRDCRDQEQVGAFFEEHYPDDRAMRRRFVWQSFRPILDELEFEGTPVERQASELLTKLEYESIMGAWERALARRREDPEGAITAARSLVESVCKHVLDESEVPYAARTAICPSFIT